MPLSPTLATTALGEEDEDDDWAGGGGGGGGISVAGETVSTSQRKKEKRVHAARRVAGHRIKTIEEVENELQ